VTVETGRLAPDGVRTMFDRIAPFYDVMNRVMTAGLDRRWRRLAAEAVVRPGARILDGCCGTDGTCGYYVPQMTSLGCIPPSQLPSGTVLPDGPVSCSREAGTSN